MSEAAWAREPRQLHVNLFEMNGVSHIVHGPMTLCDAAEVCAPLWWRRRSIRRRR